MEMGLGSFGDRRLEKGGPIFWRSLMARAVCGLRRLDGGRAGEVCFTRFVRNPSVTTNEMIATAFTRTQVACAGRDVLAIQDTTVTRAVGSGGNFLHAMIAVDVESGAVLGALDARFMERTTGGRASLSNWAFQDRRSGRWLDAAHKAGQVEGAARVTVVADCEPAHVRLLVRAMHDLALVGGGKLAAPGIFCP